MGRSWWTRLVVIVILALGTMWFLVPTYYSFFKLDRKDRNNVKVLGETLPKWAPSARYRLSLGLDLQGGIHMVMRVDSKTGLMKRTDRRAVSLANYIRDTKKLGDLTASADAEANEITFTAKDPATMDAMEKELMSAADEFDKVSRDGANLKLRLREAFKSKFSEDAVDQAMLVIRRRIDKWGVAEVDVRKLGTDSIQISLPGQQDPEQAKELIGKTAQLEFRMVDDTSTFFSDFAKTNPPPAGITLSSWEGRPSFEGTEREALLNFFKGKEPADRLVALQCVENPVKKGQCDKYYTYLLEKSQAVTGETLSNASADRDNRSGQPVVLFQFDAQGAQEFGEMTGKNVNRRMAIVLDDNVQSAPVINERINGSGQITLGRSKSVEEGLRDANTLALVLKAGALPAPVSIGEIRQVGASLGDELIKKGSWAAIVGLLLVVVFMAIYYRVSGLVADVALILNASLILGGLALFGGTLTLPGIAGFVLTLGIAVDANVLINERVREELAAGRSPQTAVDQGYDRAFWTIFDAHVTTLIAGFILMATGTGPIRGFATALVIGIIASLFTSIVVTRVITTYLVHGRKSESVSV